MSVMADIIMLQMAHELGQHERPAWRCPDCGSALRVQRSRAIAENGTDVMGHCHDPGAEHAWYHRHGSAWVSPAEARPFA
jgi:hypothetical protein